MSLHRRRWLLGRPPLDVPFELNTDSPQAEGLIAWYPTLGSRGANVLRDYGGRGLDGAFKGAGEPAWVVDPIVGAAMDFDGSDDFIDFGSFIPVSGGGARSVFAWIKTSDAVSSQTIVEWGENDTGKRFTFYVIGSDQDVTGNLRLELQGAGETDDAVVADGKLHHVGVTCGGNNLDTCKLWLDGRLALDLTASLTINTATTHGLDIGYDPARQLGRYFHGLIADLRIHNVALSPAVIWQMCHKPWDLYRPRRRWTLAALVAAWRRHMSMMGVSTELPTS